VKFSLSFSKNPYFCCIASYILVMQFSFHDRIARRVLNNLTKQKGNLKSYSAPGETSMEGHAALVILVSFPILL